MLNISKQKNGDTYIKKEVEMMISTEFISQILMIVAFLVILVNIITEVIKKVFELSSAKTINIFVTLLSVILTVLVFIAYFQIKAISTAWYTYIALVIVGFMVAYGAMFGYDKLLSYFEKFKER